MGQAWILLIISILFVVGTAIMIISLGYTILMLQFCKKRTNLDTLNNLHFFLIGASIMFISLRYTILVFDLARKAYPSTIFLIIKVHREMGQTWILLIISVLFVIALQSCSSHWDKRYWCFDLARNAFLSTIFV